MGQYVTITGSDFNVSYHNSMSELFTELYRLGYTFTCDDMGNVIAIHFSDEMHSTDNFEALKKLSPIMADGSYIEMRGDAITWRWVYKDKSMAVMYPKIVWEF